MIYRLSFGLDDHARLQGARMLKMVSIRRMTPAKPCALKLCTLYARGDPFGECRNDFSF